MQSFSTQSFSTRAAAIPATILAMLLLVGGVINIGFFTPREASLPLMLWFAMATVGYYWTWRSLASGIFSIRLGIAIGIALRLMLVFSEPNLSDDYFRFVWDGRLTTHGIHPFLELPSHYIQHMQEQYSTFLTADLYDGLNSKNYYTVYPPVLQAIFAFATWLFPKSIYGSLVVMKLVLLCCEMGSIYLIAKWLKHFKRPQSNVLLYALNPLVILEIVGNLHFEGVMIVGLLLAMWWLVRGRWQLSAIGMSIAVAAKLLPLMFLPFLIFRMRWKSVAYFAIMGISLVVLFAPLLHPAFLENLSSSLGLYFQHFEFNASVHYVLRWIGYQIVHYNIITYSSPVLSLVVLLGILRRAGQEPTTTNPTAPHWQRLPMHFLFALTLFYLCSTTVHPWYITTLVALATLTHARYPMLWSVLIFLTYINYHIDNDPFQENLWIVAVEYIALLGGCVYVDTKK